jgi:pimeloyl-ACP methyl ester carboxylesterase
MRVIGVLVIALAVFVSVRWFFSYTPPIFGKDAVSELTAVEINDDRQYLLIRGKDKTKPVLLFLHGGPGMPAMYLAHAFQRPLEDNFVVVHWDQRASGKSFRKGTDPALITTSQLVSDAEAVIAHLRERLGVERVYLVGHSHGSYIGAILAARRPDLVKVYVGIGQVADPSREIPVQDAFLKTRLASLGLPEDTEITSANREDFLFQTGSELYGETSFTPLLVTGLLAPEYSLSDVMKVKEGSSFSSANIKRDLIKPPLMEGVDAFAVPVYFMMGEHDMVTPVPLAREYFDRLEAPKKEWIAFGASAHFPFFEEPEKFAAEMKRIAAENP